MDIKDYLPIWDKLTDVQQKKLNSSALSHSFSRGAVLHDGATGCTGLIIVKSGRLRAFALSEDGKEITLYRLFEYDFCLLSAACIMNSIQFDITLTAETDTDVFIIPTDTYKSIMTESAPLSNYTNEILASRFSDVMWLIEQIMWKSFDKRLAAFLITESSIEGSDTLRITHETIGHHLGSQREVVTRMLKYFVREGLVKLSRGTIAILDKDKLSKIV